jgi:hypothetical protein
VGKYSTAGQATVDNIICRMRISCWIHKATDTCSQYTILVAFTLQQWLQERASILRYSKFPALFRSKFCVINGVHRVFSKV